MVKIHHLHSLINNKLYLYIILKCNNSNSNNNNKKIIIIITNLIIIIIIIIIINNLYLPSALFTVGPSKQLK